ncbi:alpha/beta hydrolase [Vibrio sp.]|nr:alpha/beta hydrolase [Vibrio sp.]
MPMFKIDDKSMHYLDVGEGEVLLFGHSYLWDSEMWRAQVDVLSKQYRCIVPDFWAHGQSDFHPSSMSNLTDYANHMILLMDHLNIEQFSIVGLSVGGMWGAELVALVPHRVKSLVLADTFVGLEPEVNHNKYFAMLNTITANKSIPPAMLEQVVPIFFSRQSVELKMDYVAAFRSYLETISGDKATEIAEIGKMIFGRRDMCDEVEKFALPTLILVGSEDNPRPVLESYLMNDLISGSELVIIPQAGHISSVEQPHLVTETLERFFSNIYS